jgi:single-strand selective monofunctional uracil DNA glycosylase
MPAAADPLLAAAAALARATGALAFADPVHLVYNPLEYAWDLHAAYLRSYTPRPGACRAVFLGMNPGPWGMAQTGVPFGEVTAVRDWMGLRGTVGKPPREHPARPVTGLACTRSEVSGRRLWGLFASQWGSAEAFFAHHLVLNYCPLAFLLASGANLTPDRLPGAARGQLEALCDAHLRTAIAHLRPGLVVGIGAYAASAANRVAATLPHPPRVATLLHPSPASPVANREWPQRPIAQLRALGLLAGASKA